MTFQQARDVTRLLQAWRNGDEGALAGLMELTYRGLKEVAGHLMQGEHRASTLQTTALVHEAYLRLAALEDIDWRDRVHFYAMSARIMRRVLVDLARRRTSAKRGAEQPVVSIEDLGEPRGGRGPQLLDVDRALKALAERDPLRARVVELRFFGGLNRDEIAEALGISSATVSRRWRSARAWLLQELSGEKA